MASATTRFAAYPSAVIFDNPDGTKPIQHLLWGDWLDLKPGRNGDFCQVYSRGCNGWMHKDAIQENRLLEIIFVDIGQGDGCLIVTPEDKHMVIDAGERDNMFRFLRWRYGGFDKPFAFDCAVISHPDKDHYYGFRKLFGHENVVFRTVYHNGIMEQRGPNPLGQKVRKGRRSYLTNFVKNATDLEAFLAQTENWQHPTRSQFNKLYPSLLALGLEKGTVRDFRMLSVEDGFLPGYGPDDPLIIEILGPVVETFDEGLTGLRWLGGTGKTKNGHSVVMRLTYGGISVLLGGDLNIPSEELLLSHHTGLPCPPANVEQEEVLIEAARRVFQVDVAKSCHHGSSDFTKLFLAALNPIATVISSGDDEPHSHPRADTLGTIGVHGRGSRPLIFSTELARSAKEAIKHPAVLREQITEMREAIDDAPETTAVERRKKRDLRRSLTS